MQILSCRHGSPASRFARMPPETSMLAWVPALHAGTTKARLLVKLTETPPTRIVQRRTRRGPDKLEIRISKQIQMIKKHKFQTRSFRISIPLRFWHLLSLKFSRLAQTFRWSINSNTENYSRQGVKNAKSRIVFPLRPLRLCARYSEFWSRFFACTSTIEMT
jgi:hypothetical protein